RECISHGALECIVGCRLDTCVTSRSMTDVSRTIAVTGAGGWLGGEIVRLYPGAFALTKRNADITSRSLSLPRADVLIHAAGLAHQFQGASEEAFDAVNHRGTANVMHAAAAAGIPSVVLVSST